ncbi:hypothetical protein GOODEAATRI_020044 [Goodea atripinnis]|uniref:Uncharacterized protein n=1 Tax=Goodea atripinnis TaxID=208336 RepID=A0ABV0PFH7_9TELE
MLAYGLDSSGVEHRQKRKTCTKLTLLDCFGSAAKEELNQPRIFISDEYIVKGTQNRASSTLDGCACIPATRSSTSPGHRHRRWGKRAGQLLKLKACLASFWAGTLVGYGSPYRIPKRLLDSTISCLVPIMASGIHSNPARCCLSQLRGHGINLSNLLSLAWT